MIEKHFGTVLRRVRKGKNLSQIELANLAGLDRTYISLMERGLRKPSIDVLFRLAKALGVSASSIIVSLENELNENH